MNGASGAVTAACPRCAALNRLPAGKPAERGKCGKCGQPLFTGSPVALTTATAERHLVKADLPVLVDFWADWCGPCHAMAPVLVQAAARLEPRLRLAKVDTEAEPALTRRYGIRSLPTLALFESGREIARTSGAMPLAALTEWVGHYIELN